MYRKILIPLDGSKNAEKALPWVMPVLKHCNAKAILVQVGHGVFIGPVHIAMTCGERHCPVHRAGVDVLIAQNARYAAGDGAFPRRAWPIDGDVDVSHEASTDG